jgi:hypothetical protein
VLQRSRSFIVLSFLKLRAARKRVDQRGGHALN